MKAVVSFYSSIHGSASQAHFKPEGFDLKVADTLVVYPPGSVVDVDDDEAERLVDDRIVFYYDPKLHGTTQSDVLSRMRGQKTVATNG